MSPQRLAEEGICQVLGGNKTLITAVSTDTRTLSSGSLFIGIGGERFKAGAFLLEALERGAGGVLGPLEEVKRLMESRPDLVARGLLFLGAVDTLEALSKLAGLVRSESRAKIVAITGSAGKTTTKDILAAMLRRSTTSVCSPKSFNNDVGVPLTLLSLETDTRVGVVEMGMQAKGDLERLCRFARPDIGLVTAVGASHLEMAGTVQEVARGKVEVLQNSRECAVAPLHCSPLQPFTKDLGVPLYHFDINEPCDAYYRRIELSETMAKVKVEVLGEVADLTFNFRLKVQLQNALAALLVYRLLGEPLALLSSKALSPAFSPLRGEEETLPNGTRIIVDCYNANPLSMESALEELAGREGSKIALLGDMAELGSSSDYYHRHIGQIAARLGLTLIAVGPHSKAYLEGYKDKGGKNGVCLSDISQAIFHLRGRLKGGDLLLIKASRSQAFEKIVQDLRLLPQKESSLEVEV